MFKINWKNWLIVVLLLTNVAIWNKDKIHRLFFEQKEPTGNINVGILIDDEILSDNEQDDIILAKSYLSENYQWKCIKRAKVPLPMSPFTEGTGFHFQPVSKNSPKNDLLTLR